MRGNGHVIHDVIAIDCWRPQELASRQQKHSDSGPVRLFFLSHLHADHTVGLTAAWNASKVIYTSKVNKELAPLFLHPDVCRKLVGLEPGPAVHLLPLDHAFVRVSLIDANHVCGAVMLVFQGFFGNVLYTADFRYDSAMINDNFLLQQIVENEDLDEVYLDNTFFDPACDFESRSKVMDKVKTFLDGLPDETRVLIACKRLGKEPALAEIARHLNERILVDTVDRAELFAAMKMDNNDDTTPWFTLDPEQARIKLVPQQMLTKSFLTAENRVRPTVGVVLTALFHGWNEAAATPPPNQNCQEYGLHYFEYSDHSSYPEIIDFVARLKPKKVIPILQSEFGEGVLKKRKCFLEQRVKMTPLNSYLSAMPERPVYWRPTRDSYVEAIDVEGAKSQAHRQKPPAREALRIYRGMKGAHYESTDTASMSTNRKDSTSVQENYHEPKTKETASVQENQSNYQEIASVPEIVLPKVKDVRSVQENEHESQDTDSSVQENGGNCQETVNETSSVSENMVKGQETASVHEKELNGKETSSSLLEKDGIPSDESTEDLEIELICHEEEPDLLMKIEVDESCGLDETSSVRENKAPNSKGDTVTEPINGTQGNASVPERVPISVETSSVADKNCKLVDTTFIVLQSDDDVVSPGCEKSDQETSSVADNIGQPNIDTSSVLLTNGNEGDGGKSGPRKRRVSQEEQNQPPSKSLRISRCDQSLSYSSTSSNSSSGIRTSMRKKRRIFDEMDKHEQNQPPSKSLRSSRSSSNSSTSSSGSCILRSKSLKSSKSPKARASSNGSRSGSRDPSSRSSGSRSRSRTPSRNPSSSPAKSVSSPVSRHTSSSSSNGTRRSSRNRSSISSSAKGVSSPVSRQKSSSSSNGTRSRRNLSSISSPAKSVSSPVSRQKLSLLSNGTKRRLTSGSDSSVQEETTAPSKSVPSSVSRQKSSSSLSNGTKRRLTSGSSDSSVQEVTTSMNVGGEASSFWQPTWLMNQISGAFKSVCNAMANSSDGRNLPVKDIENLANNLDRLDRALD